MAIDRYIAPLGKGTRRLTIILSHKGYINAPLHHGVTRVRIRCIVQGLVWLDVLHLISMLVMLALYLMYYTFRQTLLNMFLVHI